MQQISDAFRVSMGFLFSHIEDEDKPTVCVEHRRFIPCRPCMYHIPATTPYSSEPQDVDRVLAWQMPTEQCCKIGQKCRYHGEPFCQQCDRYEHDCHDRP